MNLFRKLLWFTINNKHANTVSPEPPGYNITINYYYYLYDI